MFKLRVLTQMLRLCETGSEINCSFMDMNPLLGIVVSTSVSGSKGESCPVPRLCTICWLMLTEMRKLTPPGKGEISLFMARASMNLPDHQWKGKNLANHGREFSKIASLNFFEDSKASSEWLHLIYLMDHDGSAQLRCRWVCSDVFAGCNLCSWNTSRV